MAGADTPRTTDADALRAFIVEDEVLTRQIIGAHVERFGYVPVEIEPVADEILSAIASARPDDVLILDILLGPDLDGFEVVQMVGRAGFPGRLVVISGYGLDYLQILESLATAVNLRVAGIIEKPVRPAELQRILLP